MDIDEIRRQNILRLQEIAGSPRAVAEKVEMSYAQYLNLRDGAKDSKTGKPRGIRKTTTRRFEEAFGMPNGWLDTDHNNENNVADGPAITRWIPVISWVQAGEWSEAIDTYEPGYADEWLPFVRKNGEQSYSLQVHGDSMTAQFGRSYPEGCYLIVDPAKRSPANGDRIIARLKGSGNVTFKVYVEEDGQQPWLKPLNPQHKPIHDEFVVLGTITAKYEKE